MNQLINIANDKKKNVYNNNFLLEDLNILYYSL